MTDIKIDNNADVQERAPKISIRSWIMFDWAAQPFHTLIITFVFAPYFVSSVASNPAEGQAMWGWYVGIGGILIAITAPILGAMADATGPRKPWIALFSLIGVVGCSLLWFAVPGMDNMNLVAIAVIMGLIGMEFAAIFNNAMMPDLVPRSDLGRLSGSAWAVGYIGGLISLIVVLGFFAAQPSGKTMIGMEPLFGFDAAMHEGDRAAGPFTAIWYMIFVIPLFLFTPDTPRRAAITGAISKGLSELWQTIRKLPSQRSYFSFLLSSMFYRDALNGLYAFGGIYAAGVLGWTITQIGLFGILANITGAIGAWFGGRMDQRFGPRVVVSVSIMLLTLCSILIISTTKTDILFMQVAAAGSASSMSDIVFYAAGAVIGASGGALQAASRTLLVDQVDRGRVTEAFGLYALSGKATSFLAPLLIAMVTAYFAREAIGLSSVDAQRIGVSPVIALFLIGLILLPFVKSRYDR